MNRILYVLIGSGVAITMLSAFFARQDFGKTSERDVALAAAFIAILAGAAFILTHTRWGRRLTWHARKKLNDQDAEVCAKARSKGEVRTPPLG